MLFASGTKCFGMPNNKCSLLRTMVCRKQCLRLFIHNLQWCLYLLLHAPCRIAWVIMDLNFPLSWQLWITSQPCLIVINLFCCQAVLFFAPPLSLEPSILPVVISSSMFPSLTICSKNFTCYFLILFSNFYWKDQIHSNLPESYRNMIISLLMLFSRFFFSAQSFSGYNIVFEWKKYILLRSLI